MRVIISCVCFCSFLNDIPVMRWGESPSLSCISYISLTDDRRQVNWMTHLTPLKINTFDEKIVMIICFSTLVAGDIFLIYFSNQLFYPSISSPCINSFIHSAIHSFFQPFIYSPFQLFNHSSFIHLCFCFFLLFIEGSTFK